jgi:hypothetical protein
MCIISGPIEDVDSTKIFIAPNKAGNRQLTIYSNKVANLSPGNAMILPVPFPQTVEFHNMNSYTTLFEDCSSCFIKPTSRGVSKDMSLLFNNSSDSDHERCLRVYNVGSYQVTLALSLSDLKRVDAAVFTLSLGCSEVLSKDYADPMYGFIICKLADTNKSYHPFGYSHKIQGSALFIPTKHYHNHAIMRDRFYNDMSSAAELVAGNIDDAETSMTDDWEHEIYLYNATCQPDQEFTNMSSSHDNFLWKGKNYVQTHKLGGFEIGQLMHFEKHVITGRKRNIDLYATIDMSYNSHTPTPVVPPIIKPTRSSDTTNPVNIRLSSL